MSSAIVGAKGAKGGSSSSSGDESFLTKPVYGDSPVKWWHAILGVLAAGGGVYLWKRK